MNKSEFSYVGNAGDFIDLIIINLNRLYFGYVKGTVKSTSVKLLKFSGESCLSILQILCKEFDGEFYFSGDDEKTLNFVNILGIDTGLTFEYKSGLHTIKRETSNPENLITRLYVFGSERNIPSDYRSGIGRLMFEVDSKNYIEDNIATYGVIERTVYFDDIYPHRDGTISWVDGSDVLKFKDSGMDFDLNSYLLPGITAKIHFQSGNLMGYEFEVSAYDNATKQFTIIAFKDKHGLELPNATLKPAVDDTYVIIDIKLPQGYIDTAETALYDKAVLYLAKHSNPKVNYVVEPDEHYFKTNDIVVDIGDQVTIVDSDLNVDEKFRIVELTRSVCYPYRYVLKFNKINYVPKSIEKIIVDNEEEKRDLHQINRDWTEKTLLLNKIIRIEDGHLTLTANTTIAGDFQVNGNAVIDGTLSVNKLDFTPITDDNVIATINASEEGINIEGNRIKLTGDTTVEGDFRVTGDMVVDGTVLVGYTEAKCTDPDADQTSTHQAASIAGQGNLATRNTVNATYIDNNSITAVKINVTNLQAVSANMGTLTIDATLTMALNGVIDMSSLGQILLAENGYLQYNKLNLHNDTGYRGVYECHRMMLYKDEAVKLYIYILANSSYIQNNHNALYITSNHIDFSANEGDVDIIAYGTINATAGLKVDSVAGIDLGPVDPNTLSSITFKKGILTAAS